MRRNSPRFLLLHAALFLAANFAASASAQSGPGPVLPFNTFVNVTVNTLANRHTISPYIYGASFPPSEAYITNAGVTLSRWGGNNSSRYNWKLNVTNLDFDWYFENYTWNGNGIAAPGSGSFISSSVAAGGSPVMTIPMLQWVAKDSTSDSFSVAKYGAQCSTDSYRPDAGNGVESNCSTSITGNNPTDADVSLLDSPGSNDPAGSVYRNQWIASIAPNFGKQPHFYQLDNEPEIWSSTHRDVHPTAAGYDELAADIVKEGHALKSFDSAAVRFAPVFDSWWFYWNGANNNDKAAHGGQDFLPWLVNEILFNDVVQGTRSFDVFDVHAYFNGPSTGGMTTAQVRAAALRETRDWWDPNYVSESGTVNQQYVTYTQPQKTVAFVIPRMRAIANSIYPGTPVSFTEWNGAMAGEDDFSTALVDADTYGILGRERMWGASRWGAADQTSAAYQSLVLYRNADGKQTGFGTLSVSATNTQNPNLFSVYAATDQAGDTLTLMVINKDPSNPAAVSFDVSGFTPQTMKTYTLSQSSPTAIVASASKAWTTTQTFAPYTATLIVATGASTHKVAEDWDLNPDTLLAPTSGTVTIAPTLTSGTGPVTLTSATGSAGVTLALTNPTITSTAKGLITIKTPATPGLYSYKVTGQDSSGTSQTQQGWVLATVPASTLTKTGDKQTAAPGATITLTATYTPGASNATGATAGNVDLLFTTSAGTLSQRIVRTASNGAATVQLTLPATAGNVTVTATGPVFWGTPTATFTETVQ
jgi:Glycoside hydrolase family 44